MKRRELISLIRRLRNLKKPTVADVQLIRDLEAELDDLTKLKTNKNNNTSKEPNHVTNVPY